MPFFTGVANSLSIYKNLHTMVAAKASADDGVVMGQGPFSMNEVPLGFFVSILSQKNTSSLGHLRGTLSRGLSFKPRTSDPRVQEESPA